MTEAYEKFLEFDWTDERWQSHLADLYPTPNHKQIIKCKKKWYRRTIDPDFDVNYEPEAAGGPAGAGADPTAAGTGAASSGRRSPFWDSSPGGNRWASVGRRKAMICFAAHAVALTMAVGAVAGAFPAYQALVVLVGSFFLEILAKYGLKFSSQWVQMVVLDDVGVMPIMALTLLTPGMHPVIRTLALVPSFLTSLLSFAQICKAHGAASSGNGGLLGRISDFFCPLAEVSARYKLMQRRADGEVLLGFLLIGGMCTGRAVPISVLLFWNFMMMRYMMSSWTQASFRKIDAVLSLLLGRIPGISHLYELLKRQLYGFVDPESKRAGRLCTIL